MQLPWPAGAATEFPFNWLLLFSASFLVLKNKTKNKNKQKLKHSPTNHHNQNQRSSLHFIFHCLTVV